jgi:hypothetical protein
LLAPALLVPEPAVLPVPALMVPALLLVPEPEQNVAA